MATGKVERWIRTNGKNGDDAMDMSGIYRKIENSIGCPEPGYRWAHLREVDPAHDAAVSRLVEAAKELADNTDCKAGCAAKGAGLDCGCGRESLTSNVYDALAALSPASPAPAKGVRCWRRVDGPFVDSDRLRMRIDGKFEWVGNDDRTAPSLNKMANVEQMVSGGEWVECPDAPYVAPTVKEPLTVAAPDVMPPDGTRWEHVADGIAWIKYQMVDGRLIGTGASGGRYSPDSDGKTGGLTWQELRNDWKWTEIPPTPTPAAMESAEAVEARFADWGDAEIFANLAAAHRVRERFRRFLDADRTTQQARHAAEVERTRQTGIEAAQILTDQLKAKDAEIARLKVEATDMRQHAAEWEEQCKRAESRLTAAESKAGGGVDSIPIAVINKELEFAYDLANECDKHPTDFGKGRASGLRDLAGNINEVLNRKYAAALTAKSGEVGNA